MLMADGLLEALEKDFIQSEEDGKHDNNDYQLGDVLLFFNEKKEPHKVRCSDGKERTISID